MYNKKYWSRIQKRRTIYKKTRLTGGNYSQYDPVLRVFLWDLKK